MKLYPFTADITCHLANGETQRFSNFEGKVQAGSIEEAQSYAKFVVTEMVGDKGSDLTDAPVEDITIHTIGWDKADLVAEGA